MLDREFSALIGAPSSIRDEDITVKLPAEMDDSVEQINLTLHVRLSRLMATILTSQSFGRLALGLMLTKSSRLRGWQRRFR